MSEEVWQEAYYTGPRDRPAFWFWLDLRDIPLDSTRLVHIQAIDGLMELGHGPRGEVRPFVRNALQAVAHLTEVRLAHPVGWAPATQYRIQAVIDSSETDRDIIEGDRSRLVMWAMELAEQADTAAAVVWGALADGFRGSPRVDPDL